MNWQQEMPAGSSAAAGQTILLEAVEGSSRHAVIQKWLREAEGAGAATWLLSCGFEEGGVWAGIKDLLESLVPRIAEAAPDLLLKHGYELTIVLPQLRERIPVRHPLTETVSMQEKVRNYPIDRAYRVVHGLVNLLDEWHRESGAGSWVIACDSFDRAGAMSRRFFAELMRRRGARLRLTLLIAAAPAAGESLAGGFESGRVGPCVRLDLPADAPAPVDVEGLARRAQELEALAGDEMATAALYLTDLIRYNLASGRRESALKWQARALGLNNHYGFYEDALKYSEPVSQNLDLICGDNETIRWNLVGNLFGCYTAVGDNERAYRIVVEEALAKIKRPSVRVKVYYVMGMLYARYLPESDFEKAAGYLEQAIRDIEGLGEADLPADDRAFHAAFMLNGLALVRHRQKRAEEAVELCRAAGEILDTHLRPDQHRLHRSVLQYNTAQVYAFTGRLQEAVDYYSAAMEMDPNYSEYYNDRGSAHLKLGNLEEALADFLQALELSPPYPEVLTNLGQCYQLLGRMSEAAEAYSVSLDLVPTQSLALVGRAQAFEALGRIEEALADYTASLALDPKQPFTLSNRAVLHYESGDTLKALGDLDRAVELSPQTADLYQNRAVALTDLGRLNEAAADFETYLRLSPDAPDRDEVAEKLSALQTLTA